jgi:hypothetical protein
MFLTLVLFMLDLFRIRLRKHSPAVWVSQKKQEKTRKWHKVTLLETDSNVHLPTESDQGPSLPKADKWPHGQTKESMLQSVVIVMWRMMVVVAMKKIQNCLRCLVVHESALVERLFNHPVKFHPVGNHLFPFEVSSRQLLALCYVQD